MTGQEVLEAAVAAAGAGAAEEHGAPGTEGEPSHGGTYVRRTRAGRPGTPPAWEAHGASARRPPRCTCSQGLKRAALRLRLHTHPPPLSLSQRVADAHPSRHPDPVRLLSVVPIASSINKQSVGQLPSGGDAEAVGDFLRILEEHRVACERAGQYMEAEVAARRLKELRKHEEERRRDAVKAEQVAARLKVEEAHMAEFGRFNAAWDARLQEYDVRAAELIQGMRVRHAQELEAYRAKAAAGGAKPKFSKDVLNLRAIQATLAKQQEYAEAHKVKAKADALERQELDRMAAERAVAMEGLEAKFVSKQKVEERALIKRAETGRGEHRRQRQADMERLLQRYANAKNALDKAQQSERARLERELKMTSWAPRKGSGSAGVAAAAGTAGARPKGKTKPKSKPTAGRTMPKVTSGAKIKPRLAAGRT